MVWSRIMPVVSAILAAFLGGTVGLKLLEPMVDWGTAVLWSLSALFTFSFDVYPPTSELSKTFQVLFLCISTLVIGVFFTVILPPFIRWWEAPRLGQSRVRTFLWSPPLYLIVNPVDWEKVESVYEEMKQYLSRFRLVVVSEKLAEIPLSFGFRGVELVRGSLRSLTTYERSGLDHAVGAFICTPAYNNPDAEKIVAVVLSLIERYRPQVRTVAEFATRKGMSLARGPGFEADAVVCFDPTILNAAVNILSKLVLKRLLPDKKMNLQANPYDTDQAGELNHQLNLVGVEQSANGIPVQLLLPTNMDSPEESDARAYTDWLGCQRSLVVICYLSVVSDALFADIPNAFCADRVMAQALVKSMFASQSPPSLV